MKKQKTESWYTRQIVYINKLITQEDSRFVRWVLNKLKNYYTRLYETYYDDEDGV